MAKYSDLITMECLRAHENMKHFDLGGRGKRKVVVQGKLSYKYFNHKIVFARETYHFGGVYGMTVS
jgi:hypothetical protein